MSKIIVIFLFIFSMCIQADDKITIKDIKFEQPLVGKSIKQKVLNKYVTLVYIWSASRRGAEGSQPTRVNGRFVHLSQKSYADLAKRDFKILEKEYKKLHNKGLMIVASNSQFAGSPVPEVERVNVIPNNIQFPVYNKIYNIKHTSAISAPYIYVFDVGGKVAYKGKELRLGLKEAKSLLGNYEEKLLGNIEIHFLKSEYKKILKGKKLGSIHKKLSRQKNKKAQEEAKTLLKKLEAIYEIDFEELDTNKRDDPALYILEGRKFTKKWKGYKKADDLAESMNKLRKSKSFKKSLKAYSYYIKARKIYFTMKIPINGKSSSFRNKKFKKNNRQKIATLNSYCQLIKKKYKETIFAIWAKDTLKKINP